MYRERIAYNAQQQLHELYTYISRVHSEMCCGELDTNFSNYIKPVG